MLDHLGHKAILMFCYRGDPIPVRGDVHKLFARCGFGFR